MDDLLLFLILGAPIIAFVGIYVVSVFSGDYYYKDEEILKKFPHSKEARKIEADRQSGRYLEYTYVPKQEEQDYLRRYPNSPVIKKKTKK